MSRWFRVYDDIVDDPKVQRLPAELFKAWINMLAIASRNGGALPSIDDLAFALRCDAEAVAAWVAGLTDRGLIDALDDGSLSPHNWASRQFKSDADPTAADRQARKRARDAAAKLAPVTRPPSQAVTDEASRPVTRDVTPSRTDTETETDIAPPPSITAPQKGRGGDILDCIGRVLSTYPPSKSHSQAKALAAIEATPADDWPALVAGCAAYAADYRAKPTTHPIALDRFIRERIFANYAPSAAAGPPRVFVIAETEEWRERVAAGHKPSLRTATLIEGRRVEGWHFPARAS